MPGSRVIALLLLAACSGEGAVTDAGAPDAAPAVWERLPDLPEPLSNNAVAAVDEPGGCALYTALGIGANLDAAGVHARAYRLAPGAASWERLPDVPGEPRLAASAVPLRGRLYVLGGYSVGPGGGETSHARVDVYDPATGAWSPAPPMPVAVDDAVAVAWRDRFIVVVSGWSDTRNVDAVQVFDADAGAWAMATPFPGTPAFGHAGALAGDTLVVIDGVASTAGFPLVTQAWAGALDPARPTEIGWTDLGGHPGPGRYRAAGGATDGGALWFHGGTEVPYNFDGLAYDDGQPAPPLASTLAYDPVAGGFAEIDPPKPVATMDHRALARCRGRLHVIGGLVTGPAATDQVWAGPAPR